MYGKQDWVRGLEESGGQGCCPKVENTDQREEQANSRQSSKGFSNRKAALAGGGGGSSSSSSSSSSRILTAVMVERRSGQREHGSPDSIERRLASRSPP